MTYTPKTLEEAIEVILCLRKAVKTAEDEVSLLNEEIETLEGVRRFLQERLQFAEEVLEGIQLSAKEFINNKDMTCQ